MADESARLKELYSYDVLDTSPEEAFDSLTELASDICETPIALVSLVDDNRQWFKSKVGLDAQETPREIAFCHHAIESNEILEVKNATKDKRFKDNPLVTSDPNIRFYAGAPLKTPNGQNIGTLCVIDREEKKLTKFQQKALKILSEQVITQLELRKKIREIQEHQDNLIQTEKLASLGRMAGGIAHELNNPLQVLNNYLELILSRARKLGFKDDFNDVVKNSKNTVFRMARIIQTMLSFVKSRRNLAVEEVTLLSLVEDSLLLLTERLGNFKGDFNVNWDVDNQLLIKCSPVELTQVLINLISNAIDAANSTENPKVELKVSQNDKSLSFTVKDNGPGMPEDVLSKAKEPFYTTKTVGQGTGLGLFICHQVTERMNGQLEYERNGDMTEFHLRIPFSAPQ